MLAHARLERINYLATWSATTFCGLSFFKTNEMGPNTPKKSMRFPMLNAPFTPTGPAGLLHLQVRPAEGKATARRTADRNGPPFAGGVFDVHSACRSAERVPVQRGRRAERGLDLPFRAHCDGHSGTIDVCDVLAENCLKTDRDIFLSCYLSSLPLACHVSHPTMCSTNSVDAGHSQHI